MHDDGSMQDRRLPFTFNTTQQVRDDDGMPHGTASPPHGRSPTSSPLIAPSTATRQPHSPVAAPVEDNEGTAVGRRARKLTAAGELLAREMAEKAAKEKAKTAKAKTTSSARGGKSTRGRRGRGRGA